MHSISVVIPCYNAGRFLDEALASVMAQTRPPHEILVVDDGSTDDTVPIAERHAAGDPRVRVLRLPQNGGDAAARNTGLRHATGDLVAMLDADDTWEPWHLEEVGGLLDRFPEAMVASAAARFTGRRSGTVVPRFAPGLPTRVFTLALRQSPHSQSTVVARRHVLLAAGGHDESRRGATDYDLWLRLSYEHPFVCSHRVTATYRWHGQQISSVPARQIASAHAFRHRHLERMRAAGSPEVPHVEAVTRQWWERQTRYAMWERTPLEARAFLAQWRLACVPAPLAAVWAVRVHAALTLRALRALARTGRRGARAAWRGLPTLVQRLASRIRPRPAG